MTRTRLRPLVERLRAELYLRSADLGDSLKTGSLRRGAAPRIGELLL
ncbi:hypothetical protein Q0M94_19470 (plasmid) [Deinococcus radiomollis]